MRQRPGADLAEAIELGEVFNANDGVGHGEWSRASSVERRASSVERRASRVQSRGLTRQRSSVQSPESSG